MLLKYTVATEIAKNCFHDISVSQNGKRIINIKPFLRPALKFNFLTQNFQQHIRLAFKNCSSVNNWS